MSGCSSAAIVRTPWSASDAVSRAPDNGFRAWSGMQAKHSKKREARKRAQSDLSKHSQLAERVGYKHAEYMLELEADRERFRDLLEVDEVHREQETAPSSKSSSLGRKKSKTVVLDARDVLFG